MAFKKTYRKKAGKRTYKRKSYAVKRRKVSPIRAIVRKEIARNVEDKTQANFVNIRNLYSSTSPTGQFDVNNVFSCAWGSGGVVLSQNTGQGARVGNQVKLKKMTFKGSVHPMPYNAVSNITPTPLLCRMVICRLREDGVTAPAPIASSDVFQYGNTVIGLQDDIVDNWLGINKDKYIVVKQKSFKLGPASNGNASGAGLLAGSQMFVNNDFKFLYNFNIDLTKHLPKVTRFNDNNSTPLTSNLYCMIWYCNANGLPIPQGHICAAMQYVIEAHYEDA